MKIPAPAPYLLFLNITESLNIIKTTKYIVIIMPVKFVIVDTGESSKGNTSAVVSHVEALADSIKNLDVNSKNLDIEIKEKNAAAIELFHLYKTLKEEGIKSKGVEELGKSLENLNKTIEETAKRLGREVEEVHVESLGPKIYQYLKASKDSSDEAAALTELHKNYHTYHTKNGMPQHYDVYDLEEFRKEAAELKKILLGYGDLSISLDFYNKNGNGGTGGGSPKIIGGQAGQGPQIPQVQQPQVPQPQQPVQQTPQKFTYKVGGDGLVGKAMEGVTLPDFLRDLTSAKLNIIPSGHIAGKEYSEQIITKYLNSALGGIYNNLKTIVEYTSNSNIKTQYLEGMLKELDDFKNNHIVSKDVKQFIDTMLDSWTSAIKNNDLKDAVKIINKEIKAMSMYISSTRPDEVGRLEIANVLDDAAQKIAKEGNKLSKIAKGSPALSPSGVEKKIDADIYAAEHFWIAEQLYALIASKVLLELNAQLREIIVTGGKNEEAIKKELLNRIESYIHA